jgi:hypothetical protein
MTLMVGFEGMPAAYAPTRLSRLRGQALTVTLVCAAG